MVRLTVTEKVPVQIIPRDAKGNVASVDGVPQWSSSDPNVITVVPAADGMSCDVVATGATGTALVTVTGDADLGAGVIPIVGTLDVVVAGGQAVVIEIVAGTPVAQ